MGAETKVPNLYIYDKEEITTFVQKAGYDTDALFELRRNSNGTRLFVSRRGQDGTKVLIVSSDGVLKALTAPARFAYLGDQEEFEVWFDDIKKGLHFQNGSVRSIPDYGTFGIDFSGNYFFIEVEPGLTEIYRTSEPDRSLALAELTGREIFSGNGHIYLFDYDSVNYATRSLHGKIICQVFNKGDTQLELQEEIHIPRPSPQSSPFAVLDMDTKSGRVLVLDVRDPPLSSLTSWYVFELDTRTMTKVGSREGTPLFLKNDILNDALQKLTR
jgi:hypothetical protein